MPMKNIAVPAAIGAATIAFVLANITLQMELLASIGIFAMTFIFVLLIASPLTWKNPIFIFFALISLLVLIWFVKAGLQSTPSAIEQSNVAGIADLWCRDTGYRSGTYDMQKKLITCNGWFSQSTFPVVIKPFGVGYAVFVNNVQIGSYLTGSSIGGMFSGGGGNGGGGGSSGAG